MVTVVAFHAHPDDEVLATGGTLARLAAEGHRVVIVVASDGWMGARTEPGASTRLDELRASAAVLGAARVEHLGYADSGTGPVLFPDPPDRQRFVRADIDEAAERLAALIRAEHADVLLSYDAQGGYGHRDHVRVHDVGARAAELTGVRVLEATAPREYVRLVFGTLRALRLVVRHQPADIRTWGTPRAAITLRVNVRRYARQKQAALAAHRSVVQGTGRLARLMRLLLALPVPVFGLVLGREWFTETGAATSGSPDCDARAWASNRHGRPPRGSAGGRAALPPVGERA
ncbi:MAG TPA: PIG-L family deacetylase [Streptosporangiaceae bacterium]|nr:PIG-L family deacetylase [Streptosporangiaceae bacterium]